MEATIFLPLIIIALTQMAKEIAPERIHGIVTTLVALAMGVIASVFASFLGLADITIAEGIVSALGAIGITTAVGKAG